MTQEGYRLRAVRREDLAALVDLLNSCDVAEYGLPETTVADIAGQWMTAGFEPARDAVVAATPDRAIVGYGAAGDQHHDGRIDADLFVDPQWADSSVGADLLAFIESRARGLARTAGYAQASAAIYVAEVNSAKRALLREAGFAVRRRLARLEGDIAEAGPAPLAPPPSVAIRSLLSGVDDEAIYRIMVEAFANDSRVPEESFEHWHDRLMGEADFAPDLWVVATIDDQPVGAVLGYDHGDLGWIKGLAVRADQRGCGIGSALLTDALRAMAARGLTRVAVGAESRSEGEPGGLCERLGMTASRVHHLWVKPLAM